MRIILSKEYLVLSYKFNKFIEIKKKLSKNNKYK